MQEQITCGRPFWTERTDFHGICDCVFSERGVGVRVVILLGCCPGIFVLVQLLGPAGGLVRDESACGPHKTDGAIRWLQLGHIAYVPPLKNYDSIPLNPNKKRKIKNLKSVWTVQQSIEEFVKSGTFEENILHQWNNRKKEYNFSKAESLYRKDLVMDATKLGYPKTQTELCQRYFKG